MNFSISKLGAVLFGIGEKHCEQHASILKTLEKTAIQQARNVDHIAENTKDIKDINEHITKINYNVAYLTGKTDQRRNSHRGDKDVKDSET